MTPEFGSLSNESRPEGPPDPWTQDKLNQSEKDGTSPTDNQLSVKWLRLGRFKIPVGFRVSLGAGIKFRLPRQRDRSLRSKTK